MPRYGFETNKSAEGVVAAAIAFFGEGGLGLRAEEQGGCCAYFEGGGGFVRVTARHGAQRTEVDLETREWDQQVLQFIRKTA
jgi:hypothetical protein